MKKRIAVIGKGTAGAQSASHFLRWFPDYEIEWHYDPSVPTQAVGEGSLLTLPRNLNQELGFSYDIDLPKLDGTFKTGIAKYNWGEKNEFYFHDFPPPQMACHFSAVKLQNFIFEKIKDRVKIVEHSVTHDELDADYVLDCSGKPKSYEAFHNAEFIPVNAVHVNQCFWEGPRFFHTKAVARKYGWVFMIPLLNRCSVGYLYNRNINGIDEIKEDILEVIKQFDLTPSTTTNSFTFENYYRKQNFFERHGFNGNASFFLEPLEATSLGTMDYIQREVWDYMKENVSLDEANELYVQRVKENQAFIMLHYMAGSKFKTPFWEFAKERGDACLVSLKNDEQFKLMCDATFSIDESYKASELDIKKYSYMGFWVGSFFQNIYGLGIEDKLKAFLNY